VKEFLDPPHIITIFGFTAIAFVLVLGVSVVLCYFLRDKITAVLISRFGLEIHTNDVSLWCEVQDEINQIDSGTRKSIRKTTSGLHFLAPKPYEKSTGEMLVNRDATLSLICAAYENHHTRELASDGGDVYISEKTHDIAEAVRDWKKLFPELTFKRVEAVVCYWFKQIVLPNLRKACLEKVAYYDSQIKRKEVSTVLKAMLTVRRDKNLFYLEKIKELNGREDITEKSTIIHKEQNT